MTAFIAAAYLAKTICAVIVIFFITQVRSLTPKWPWEWRHHQVLEKLVRTGICFAWLIFMIENNYAAFSLFLGERAVDVSQNSVVLYALQQTASVLILAHFAWLAWRADFRQGS